MNLLERIEESTAYIKSQCSFKPVYGIILGTGLGNLVSEIDIKQEIPYTDIPHFPLSTLEFHKGKLIFGYIGEKPIVAMQGRFHYYEGYTMQEVTFPVRVLKALGISHLFISNAAGSVSESIEKGHLMIIEDHINLQPSNPLIGVNHEELGPRFPDMSEPYAQDLVQKGMAIAEKNGIVCHKGVYVSVPGPNLETKAEYVYLNRIGADAVGMSTVPEVIVGVHSGLKIFGISVITDEGYPPEKVKLVTLEDVLAVAKVAEPKMTLLLKELISSLDA